MPGCCPFEKERCPLGSCLGCLGCRWECCSGCRQQHAHRRISVYCLWCCLAVWRVVQGALWWLSVCADGLSKALSVSRRRSKCFLQSHHPSVLHFLYCAIFWPTMSVGVVAWKCTWFHSKRGPLCSRCCCCFQMSANPLPRAAWTFFFVRLLLLGSSCEPGIGHFMTARRVGWDGLSLPRLL